MESRSRSRRRTPPADQALLGVEEQRRGDEGHRGAAHDHGEIHGNDARGRFAERGSQAIHRRGDGVGPRAQVPPGGPGGGGGEGPAV